MKTWWANMAGTRSLVLVLASVFVVHLVASQTVDLPSEDRRYELLLGGSELLATSGQLILAVDR